MPVSNSYYDRFQPPGPGDESDDFDEMSIEERIAVAKAQIEAEARISQSIGERDICVGLRMAVATLEKFGL